MGTCKSAQAVVIEQNMRLYWLKSLTLSQNFMTQQLTLEISDEVYADLQRKASAVGISITE